MFVLVIVLLAFVCIWWHGVTEQENHVKVDFLIRYGKDAFINKFGFKEYQRLIR